MIRNKSLFKNISLFLCLVPMLLLSLFVAFPKKELKSVYAADETIYNYTFNGSNLLTTTCTFMGSSPRSWHFVNFRVSFSHTNEYGYSLGFKGYVFSRGISTDFGEAFTLNSTFNNLSTYNYLQAYIVESQASNHYIVVRFYRSDTFNGNVQKLVINSEILGEELCNYVTYYDTEGNYFKVSVATQYGQSYSPLSEIQLFKFDERTYYLTPDLTDNSIYDIGYNDGYTAGNSAGINQGYNDGYTSGESIGYGNGYSAGIEQSNNYSFTRLIGAVIDAPVSAFTSLLNFNILGVNILAFVTGLLTLALIIFIIKLCMGGK